jgi:hypothetical protein
MFFFFGLAWCSDGSLAFREGLWFVVAGGWKGVRFMRSDRFSKG